MTLQDQIDGAVPAALFEEIADLCSWLDIHALPLWLDVGFDDDLGLFHERLDLAGQPITDVPRRLLVQCRQISVYAYATLRGRLDAKKKLKAIYDRVRTLYQIKDRPGYWRYSINVDGTPSDDRIDSYTLAFVLFAIAWLYRLDANENYLSDADAILEVLDGPLSAEGGGIAVGLNQADNFQLQNPNMHFFEACLMLYEATGRKKDFDRAQSLARFFSETLFDKDLRAIPERHLAGWTIHDPETNWFEPGHHFEWSWLLRQWERLGGDDQSSLIKQLSDRALAEGLDQETNVIEKVGLNKNFKKKSSRNWGICEFLKFAAAEYQEAIWRKDKEAANLWLSRSFESLKVLRRVFLTTPVSGTWHDRVDEAGHPTTDYSPASSFYHIVFAIAEVERAFTRVVPERPMYRSEPQRALFLDRDGVINVDIAYAHRPEQIEFVSGIFELVKRANDEQVKVIVVTNQSGVARSYYSERDVILLHNWMASEFRGKGAIINAFYHCPYIGDAISSQYRRENHYDRKPLPGMLKRAALEWNIDFEKSLLVGDQQTDMEAAASLNIKSLIFELGTSNLNSVLI